jgi:hypothetical protein
MLLPLLFQNLDVVEPTIAEWIPQGFAPGTYIGQEATTGEFINQGSAGGSWVKKQEIDIT